MYPTLAEVRTARELRDGAHHVPTPGVLLALARGPQGSDQLPTLAINDVFLSDLMAAQLRIEGTH